MSNAAAIKVSGVGRKYRSRAGIVNALEGIDLTVESGQFVSVLGPSGCGKSTLLRLVAGLDEPTSGEIEIEGLPVTGPQTQVGMVFQNAILLDWRTTLGNVAIQGEAHHMAKDVRERRATELLTSVGLGDFLDKYPAELSGGMQQRVSICRALLHDPALILMDEPFGALDAMTRDQMNVDLQNIWMGGGKSVLFITHSISEAVFLSDVVMVMSGRPGRVKEIVTIDLPRPRDAAIRDTEAFGEYTRRLRESLADEESDDIATLETKG